MTARLAARASAGSGSGTYGWRTGIYRLIERTSTLVIAVQTTGFPGDNDRLSHARSHEG